MQANFIVSTNFDVSAVGGAIRNQKLTARKLDQRVIARYPFVIDNALIAWITAHAVGIAQLGNLSELAAGAHYQLV